MEYFYQIRSIYFMWSQGFKALQSCLSKKKVDFQKENRLIKQIALINYRAFNLIALEYSIHYTSNNAMITILPTECHYDCRYGNSLVSYAGAWHPHLQISVCAHLFNFPVKDCLSSREYDN